MQNIISKCQVLLSIQPVKQGDAQALDQLVCTKVHDLLGFPYHPNTKILTLPLEKHGLDFPSIERINAGIAVEGLMRDLNHHIPAYKTMARITLADWMCEYNKCSSPTDGDGGYRYFSHYYGRIPTTWLVAHKIMASTTPPLNLCLTEANYILRGEVSIHHASNMAKKHGLQVLNGTSLLMISKRGYSLMKDIGTW